MLCTILCCIGPRYNGTAWTVFLSKLYWQITFVNSFFAIQFQFQFQFLDCQFQFQFLFITLQPSGLEGYCRTGMAGWAARLPDFAECTFLKLLNGFSLFKAQWNCVDLKLCSIMIICQFAAYGLPMGQKLVKTGSNGVPTLPNTYLWVWNCWTDLLHSKFYGIVWTCSCATSWSFTHLPHMVLPMGQKLGISGAPGVPTLRNTNLWNHVLDGLHRSEFYGIV